MASVTGMTAAAMEVIRDASIVDGAIDGVGHLILTTFGGTDIDAGYMIASVPDADTTVKGIVELATTAEVIAAIDTLRAVTPASLARLLAMTGEVRLWAPPTVPSGWLICNGASLLRTTEPTLFEAIAPSLGVATITITSPGVITCNNHGLVYSDAVFFETTGALPTGLTANTIYYVHPIGITSNAFRVSATDGGAAINTSGSQSGVHTLRRGPYGIADSTHFNVPDMRKRVPVGVDVTQTEFSSLGKTGGEKTHVLLTSEMPSHDHHVPGLNINNPGGAFTINDNSGDYLAMADNAIPGINGTIVTYKASNTSGGGSAHNILQPYRAMNFIIKT